MTNFTRRSFTKATAAAGIVTALSASRVYGANDRVRVGFVGLGNRGDQVLGAFLEHGDAQVAAICDLNPAYRDFAAAKRRRQPRAPKTTASCWSATISTRWPWSRPITGTRCR